MLAMDQVERGGKRGGRDAGRAQRARRVCRLLWLGPGSEKAIDFSAPRGALAKAEPGQRRQGRHDHAQPLPLRVVYDGEAEPVVLAGTAIGAMRRVPAGAI